MGIDAQMARRVIVEAEFRALQAMCSQPGRGAVWQRAIELLSGYRFRDPLHQLLFDVLHSLPAPQPPDLRTLLTRQLTVRGFPDVEIGPFLGPHAMTDDLALSIIEHLRFTERLDRRPELTGRL